MVTAKAVLLVVLTFLVAAAVAPTQETLQGPAGRRNLQDIQANQIRVCPFNWWQQNSTRVTCVCNVLRNCNLTGPPGEQHACNRLACLHNVAAYSCLMTAI